MRTSSTPVLTAVARRSWARSVFGIVAPGEVRRRPSDVARVVGAGGLVTVLSVWATNATAVELRLLEVIGLVPDALEGVARLLPPLAGAVAVGLLVATLVAGRPRLAVTLALAGALAAGLAVAVDALVDLDPELAAAAEAVRGADPAHPLLWLATAFAVVRAARPFLTRPVRRALGALVAVAALAALYLGLGAPGSVLTTVVLAWGAAAAAHLALGSPGGTPSADQVRSSLAELGLAVDDVRLAPDQGWGRTTFRADGPDGALTVSVIGRDSTDAQLLTKLWRFVWYKDAGPTVALRRDQQLEHDALVLLLAERSGARVPHLVAVGTAGVRDDALLVVREPEGTPLSEGEPDDGALDAAWVALGRLHVAGIAHGEAIARHVRGLDDGEAALVQLDGATASASAEHLRLDRVHLLVSTAGRVGPERALAAALRALGTDEVSDLLPLLTPAALTPRARAEVEGVADVLATLQAQGAEHTGVAAPGVAELRRFSVQGIVLAGAFALGVYLLVAQLADVAAMGDVFAGAVTAWVVATFVLGQLPQPFLAVAMLGTVSTPLALRHVTMVQFANAFTGLVGGTAGNATLVIRFFQRQGLPASVSVSSGLLNSAAGFVVQLVLVVGGLLLVGSDLGLRAGGVELPGWLLAAAAVVVLAAVVVALVPAVRRRLRAQVESQVRAAVDNLRGVLSRPVKAVQLFGGNLAAQLLFALTLSAALHAYGTSLPLGQIIVINALASFVGGAAPVPGGMGVVEAGLVGGFTAAGIGEADAVAATFTARMCTSYLPPVWGWFAFRWLRGNDLV